MFADTSFAELNPTPSLDATITFALFDTFMNVLLPLLLLFTNTLPVAELSKTSFELFNAIMLLLLVPVESNHLRYLLLSIVKLSLKLYDVLDIDQVLLHIYKKRKNPGCGLNANTHTLKNVLRSMNASNYNTTMKIIILIIQHSSSIRTTKQKVYFPDIYIPKQNLIIEVKSTYTYSKEYDKNIAKANATKNTGYNFEFWIYDGKGNKVVKTNLNV
jgi:hypothetical protein